MKSSHIVVSCLLSAVCASAAALQAAEPTQQTASRRSPGMEGVAARLASEGYEVLRMAATPQGYDAEVATRDGSHRLLTLDRQGAITSEQARPMARGDDDDDRERD
jgi:hypothetical protein